MFPGKSNGQIRSDKMLMVALKRGESTHAATNRRITVGGEYEQYLTWAGPRHYLDGTVTCYHFNTKVFAVNFRQKEVTNFGFGHYSPTTSMHIQHWSRAVARAFNMSSRAAYGYSSWINNHSDDCDEMVERFKAKVPWCVKDAYGCEWFKWGAYNDDFAQQLWASKSFLVVSQRWRYFTYDWDEAGNWSRKFIDADAEKRWHAREKRQAREIRNRVPGVPGSSNGRGRHP